MTFNNTEKDVIPPLSLEYNCCTSEGKPAKLKDFHLEHTLAGNNLQIRDKQLQAPTIEVYTSTTPFERPISALI
jgi:hypothetical protein